VTPQFGASLADDSRVYKAQSIRIWTSFVLLCSGPKSYVC